MTEYQRDMRWSRASECCDVVRSCYKKMDQTDMIEEMKKVYAYVKEISSEFYINTYIPHMHSSYDFLRNEVLSCEDKLSGQFITYSNPVFDFYENMNINDNSDYKSILDYIVHHVRRYLVLKYSLRQDRPVDINRLTFENDCILASNKVKGLCDRLWLESYVVGIYPGYDKYSDLFNGNGFHMCNIVKIEDEYYLIDCTYRQFFMLKKNILERLGIVNLSGVSPGRFMMMNDNRKNVADSILKYGWIKLDADILKSYLDGFTLSFRNGLYYEQTRDFSYTTNYTVDDYIKFLSGQDNQLNHEDKEFLGFQKKPLKNHKISF